MKLTLKIFFIIPDQMRPCKIFRVEFNYGGFLKYLLRFANLENLSFCIFHLIMVKFVMGVTLDKEQNRISLK